LPAETFSDGSQPQNAASAFAFGKRRGSQTSPSQASAVTSPTPGTDFSIGKSFSPDMVPSFVFQVILFAKAKDSLRNRDSFARLWSKRA
jgi:hypothetical protein